MTENGYYSKISDILLFFFKSLLLQINPFYPPLLGEDKGGVSLNLFKVPSSLPLTGGGSIA